MKLEMADENERLADPRPALYREKAKELELRASALRPGATRDDFLELARNWRDMADHLERLGSSDRLHSSS